MAKMLRYAFFFATRIIFKYFYKRIGFTEPADASYIAKDGLTIPDFSEGDRVETIYFMFQISVFYLILCSRIIF
jgi:preprotein translocase subunit SecY